MGLWDVRSGCERQVLRVLAYCVVFPLFLSSLVMDLWDA